MVINKSFTNRNQKESSSLTNQKKFSRRSDITPSIRFSLGIAGLGPQYREETIWELCARYQISHEFIYSLSRILRQEGEVLFSVSRREESTDLDKVLQSMRFYIESKMETQGPLYGLSRLGESIRLPYSSTNFISQTLETAGNLLGNTVKSNRDLRLIYLCDEIYSGGQAILVTMEAQSMMVLDIKLLDSSLTQQDWEQSWLRLQSHNIQASELVKDQGVAMQAAVGILPKETLILPDSFHAVSHRLGIFAARLIRQTEACIENEWARKEYLDKAKTIQSQAKQREKYEIACFNTIKAIDELEWFEEHYFNILRQFRPFTTNGEPRNKAAAVLAVEQSIEALKLLSSLHLTKPLIHIEKLLKEGLLFKFLDKIPSLYEQLGQIVGRETQWLWALNWQWQKKARQTHSPKVQQYAKQEAHAAQQLLEEYYANSSSIQELKPFEQQDYQTIYPKIMIVLEQIVQSSALVETFNSILKPFINSARGQLTQSLLNLVMFYHNHRQFQRGLRKGKAPIELLTGLPLTQSWIDIVMDKIKAAFEHFDLKSLKNLHHLSNQQVSEKQNQLAIIRVLEHPNIQNGNAHVA